jgi:transcriptional antiterminator RfaH
MDWYCIHTKPQKESAVEFYIRRELALETYYPRLKRQKTIRRVKRWIIGPLFPRYVFCRLDLDTHYRGVRYAPAAIDFVTFGERPTAIGDDVINELKGWAADAVDIITIQPRLKCGDIVEITDGPLQGLRAIVERDMTDRERVTILLSTLAYQARAVVTRSQVALVS